MHAIAAVSDAASMYPVRNMSMHSAAIRSLQNKRSQAVGRRESSQNEATCDANDKLNGTVPGNFRLMLRSHQDS